MKAHQAENYKQWEGFKTQMEFSSRGGGRTLEAKKKQRDQTLEGRKGQGPVWLEIRRAEGGKAREKYCLVREGLEGQVRIL